jgi:hypothetical protein
VVGCSTLACQICIPFAVLVLGGGLASSKTSLLVETPFLVRFRRLEGADLLASRFDIGEKVRGTRITSTQHAQKRALEAEPRIKYL